jgi:hypothetical protein
LASIELERTSGGVEVTFKVEVELEMIFSSSE